MDPITRTEDRRRARALAALQATPALRDVSQRHLGQLLGRGREQSLADGATLCRETDDADAFFIVLDGRLEMRHGGEYIAPIPPGGSFAFEAVLSGRHFPATANANGPTNVIRIPRDAVLGLLDDSAPLRQALRPITTVSLDAIDTAEVVQLRSEIEGAPLTDLTVLLAKQIATDFGDHVLILRPGERVTSPRLGPQGLLYAEAPPAEVRWHTPFFDYVFLDGFGEDLPAVDGRGDFTALTLVRGAPPATKGTFPKRLYTVVVDERAPRGRGDVRGFPADGPPPAHRRAPCWVHLRLDALRGCSGERGLEGLDSITRESLGRMARALTQRRVGLTLSGGGAWGFIHTVLLEGLVKLKVPVDIVTSASIGTLVGAFYCTGGIEATRRLLVLADNGALDRAAFKSILNTDALRLFVEEHLGQRWLEHLAVRFHPVATDLNTAQGFALDAGPLGVAVRASCSAPGVWQPTILGDRHYVDGCVTHNTPSSILPSLGAHLVFASNCYPAAQRMFAEVDQVTGWTSRVFGSAQRAFGQLLPVARVLDLMCAGDLMLHASGELEAQGSDVYYSERPGANPLLGASRFTNARTMISDRSDRAIAARLDAMDAKVEEFAAKWDRMKTRSQTRAVISINSGRPPR